MHECRTSHVEEGYLGERKCAIVLLAGVFGIARVLGFSRIFGIRIGVTGFLLAGFLGIVGFFGFTGILGLSGVSGAGDDGIYVYVQEADGSFEEVLIDSGTIMSGDHHMADLDGDGDMDFIWAIYGPLDLLSGDFSPNSEVNIYLQD